MIKDMIPLHSVQI